jgi:hypothetical protein
MKLYRCVAWQIGLFLSCGLAWSQAIDPSRASATIGQPLDLRLLVRPAPELGSARFDRRCIHADVEIGDRWLVNATMQVDIGTPDDEGLSAVRLSHPTIVDEPIVHLRLSMICGAPYSREFNVLAHAPRESKTLAQPQRPASTRSATTAHASRPVLAMVPADAPTTAAMAPGHEARPDHHATFNASAADKPAVSGELQALARSVMNLVQAAGLDARAGPGGAGIEARFDPAIALDTADNKYLLQELHRLRNEQQQTSSAIASLHARLARADDERWAQAVWMACAALAALLAFGLLLRISDALLPALARRIKRAPVAEPQKEAQWQPAPRADPETGTRGVIQPPQTVASREAAWKAVTGVDQAIDFDPTPGMLAWTADAHSSGHTAKAPVERLATTDGALPDGLVSPRTGRWAHASFGPASLDHHRVTRELRDGINSAIDEGYLGFAATMLEKTLHSDAGKYPWLLMRLLDVYDQLGQPENHERVCAEIAALYNVRPPTYRAAATEHDHASVVGLEHSGVWPALQTAWQGREAADLIASLLLRSEHGVELDLADFAELLFLHELAQIREHEPLAPNLATAV